MQNKHGVRKINLMFKTEIISEIRHLEAKESVNSGKRFGFSGEQSQFTDSNSARAIDKRLAQGLL